MKKHDINIEYVSSISIINITETKSFEKYEKCQIQEGTQKDPKIQIT